MKNDYWTNFWITHGKSSKDADKHTQVLRTVNKQPISQEEWDRTLSYIKGILAVESDDTILDLCSGNGLISKYLSGSCKKVIAVDVSKDLLDKIDEVKYPNISKIPKDIREVSFPNESLNKVLIYAGIQYLTLKETVELFEKVYNWLKPNGLLFIGDIPDRDKIWNFFNTSDREAVHFNCVKEEKAIIGTWFEASWLTKLSNYSGFYSTKVLKQAPELLNAKSRFDLITHKKKV